MPPEEDRATAAGDLRTKLRKNRSSSSRDMLAHRHTDKQTDRNTLLPHQGGVTKMNKKPSYHRDVAHHSRKHYTAKNWTPWVANSEFDIQLTPKSAVLYEIT